MAAANCAAFSFLRPNIISTNIRGNKRLLLAYIPTPSKPVKFSKRRNSLRPKILTKPYSPSSENPISPILYSETPNQELMYNQTGESYAAVAGEDDRVEEFRLSETSGADLGAAEFSGKIPFLRFGAYLIGLFVFQTIVAVWVMGSAASNQRDESLDGSNSGKRKLVVNGNEKALSSNLGSRSSNLVYMDESQLEEKIEEIRAMAKEARKVEKKDSKKGSGTKNGVVNESLNSRNKLGIEKEISSRLLKLQKSLNSAREKFSGSSVNYLSKSGNDSNSRNGNETLMFKKKLKFKSPSIEQRKSPKGFGNSENKGSKGRKRGLYGSRGKMVENGSFHNEEIQQEKDLTQSDWNNLDKGMRRKNGGKEVSQTRKQRNGVIQESRLETSSVEVAKPRKLGDESDEVFTKENQETMDECTENPVLSRNGSSRRKEAEKKPASDEVPIKQSSTESDMWWLNLPYVIVVLMQRDSDPEGSGGLYTLEFGTDFSYTVAFEDRSDANNFCFLLDSFFEDLGDVRVDIVPLSTKELHQAVKSQKWKVIVVKKGQLQLYAGQPFADVEMALHTLVKETQTAV